MPKTKTSPPDGARHPRGRGSVLTTGERSAVIGMSLSGLSGSEIARRTGRNKRTVLAVLNSADAREARELAKDVLTRNAEAYAQLHIEGAKVAALKGDSRPVEWALDRLGVVEPIKREDAPRVQVSIGVLLPGLPGSTATLAPMLPQAIEAQAIAGGGER